jgi:hypothetical protein
VKKITHRINKYQAWRLPSLREIDQVVMKSDTETILVSWSPHRMEAPRHSFRVAMFAACADFCASCYRIPRRFCPFDMGFVGHGSVYTVAEHVENLSDDLCAVLVWRSKVKK